MKVAEVAKMGETAGIMAAISADGEVRAGVFRAEEAEVVEIMAAISAPGQP